MIAQHLPRWRMGNWSTLLYQEVHDRARSIAVPDANPTTFSEGLSCSDPEPGTITIRSVFDGEVPTRR